MEPRAKVVADQREMFAWAKKLGGVWSEACEDGDLDHKPLAQALRGAGFKGPLIIEQAHEAGTPQTMGFEAALKRSACYARELFGVE